MPPRAFEDSAQLAQIKNEEQLITLVKVRYSLPSETARADVQGWMAGKQF